LAIWLTWTKSLHAEKVAQMLGVSKQAIWLWLNRYQKQGPEGLQRQERGRRRWSLLELKEEQLGLARWAKRAQQGEVITARRFRDDCCLMLLDSTGWHRAHALLTPKMIRLISLPPYSPELKPVEHIWDYLRDYAFGNSTFDSLDQVEKTHCRGLKALNQQPQPVHPITCFDWSYLAAIS
jgi:biotin operon repressor